MKRALNMKNHWLDKKVDREIDDAFKNIDLSLDDFKDTDFIDLSAVPNKGNSRYKEYDRLVLEEQLKFVDELEAKCNETKDIPIVDLFNKEFCEKKYDILTSTDAEDREMVKAILLKNFHKTHWLEEIMTEVKYTPHLAPGCDPSIAEYAYRLGDDDLGNLTISCSGDFPESTTTTTFINPTPGGDSIMLGDLPGWKDGKIVDMDLWKGKCETCGEYQWPMNDEHTMTQGDPMCKCYSNSNLEIWYGTPFIQNEKLQVYADINTGVTQYQTMHTPVLAGTMTGTIYPTPGNTSYGFTFVVSSDGKFTFDAFVQDSAGNVEYSSKQNNYLSDEACLQAIANGEYDERFMGWYDEPYVEGTNINLATGVLELHYHMGHQPEIIVSYEYNLDGEAAK